MNIFVEKLSDGALNDLDHHEHKLVIEDNIGEGIHIHIRNVRLEMTIDDFMKFSEETNSAVEEFDNGNC